MLTRAQKESEVAELRDKFARASSVIVADYRGLSVQEVNELRAAVRKGDDCEYKVAKNTLLKLAVAGSEIEGVSEHFSGPTAVAFSEDPVAAAKVAVDFAKSNDKLTIIGGGLGEKELDQTGVEALAKLPSLDELRAKIVGMINTPATRIAGVLQAPGGQLARVVSAYSQKGDAA